MWRARDDGAYITIERDTFVVVCPIVDVRPHNIGGMSCDCGERVEAGDEYGMYDKPMVIHNRHSDNDLIEASMKRLTG